MKSLLYYVLAALFAFCGISLVIPTIRNLSEGKSIYIFMPVIAIGFLFAAVKALQKARD